MEVRIIIDDRIIAVVKRITNRPLLAVATGLVTLVAGTGVVYAVAPMNTFSASTVISATAVNENFSILRAAVEDLENAPPSLDGCWTGRSDGCDNGGPCLVSCPSGQYPVGGGCDTVDSPILASHPTVTVNSGVPDGPREDLRGWVCAAESGMVWPFVICCP